MARGSISKRQRKDGSAAYRVRIATGTRPDGTPIIASATFDRKRDADDWLTRMRHELRAQTYVPPSDETVSEVVADWLASSRAGEHTRRTYAGLIRTHIDPTIGARRLRDLTARDVQRLYRRVGQRAPSRAWLVAVVLRGAIRQAMAQGRLARDPTAGVPPPTQPRREPDERLTVWTADQLTRFLDATRGHRDWPAWWLIAHTGLRAGEAVALRWEDVDLETGRLRVRRTETQRLDGSRIHGTPKTRGSVRTIGIDAETVAVLKEHRRQQAERRLGLGDRWQDHGLVFDGGDGAPRRASTISDSFGYRVGRLGMEPRITLHDLRDTHASILIAEGRPLLYVSRRLGHSSITITGDVYGHLLPDQSHADAEAFAAVMQAARERAISDVRDPDVTTPRPIRPKTAPE